MKRWRVSVVFKDREREPHSFILYSIHAKVNKTLRADSVAIHYDMGHIHHPVAGLPICDIPTCRANLEDQMVLWSADKKDSPDRMDAAVYTLLHIFGMEHALKKRHSARVDTAARAKDMPQYDPRTTVDETLTTGMTRHSRVYTVDVGGYDDRSNGIRLAGIRRLPRNPVNRD